MTIGRMGMAMTLARWLGPDLFGVFAFVQWLVDITFIAISVGLPGVATRFFPQFASTTGEDGRAFDAWFWRAGALAIVFAAFASGILVRVFSQVVHLHDLVAVVCLAASSAFYSLANSRAQGRFQYKRVAFSSLLFMLMAAIGLLLIKAEPTLSGIFITLCVSNLIAAVALTWGELPAARDLSLSMRSPYSDAVTRYGRNAWVVAIISSLLWSRGELPLVEGYLGKESVGYYAIGLTISGIINQGVGLLAGALWPLVARTWDTGNEKELMRFEAIVTNTLILAAGVSVGFVICFSPHVILMLFGDKYGKSADLVFLLAIGALGLSSGCANLIVQAATNGTFGRNANIVGVLALFSLAALLTPRYGVEGAAFARATVQIGIAGVTFVAMLRLLKTTRDMRRGFYSFIATFFLTIALSGFRLAVPRMSLFAETMLFLGYAALVWAVCSRAGRINIFDEIKTLGRFENGV